MVVAGPQLNADARALEHCQNVRRDKEMTRLTLPPRSFAASLGRASYVG
jgi:hypothetical protein